MDIVKNENITFLISMPGTLVTNILLVFFPLFFWWNRIGEFIINWQFVLLLYRTDA